MATKITRKIPSAKVTARKTPNYISSVAKTKTPIKTKVAAKATKATKATKGTMSPLLRGMPRY